MEECVKITIIIKGDKGTVFVAISARKHYCEHGDELYFGTHMINDANLCKKTEEVRLLDNTSI